MKQAWKSFPFKDDAYDNSGPRLKKRWAQLHTGDREPFPDETELKRVVALHPAVAPLLSLEETSGLLQAAWRSYHKGDFEEAVRTGLAAGPLGYNAANRAAVIYASNLETSEQRKVEILREAADRARELQKLAPSLVNAWYLHALAIGRYAQAISVARALAEGIGGTVKASLEEALRLDPHHAEAHIALGAFEAEIVRTLGTTLGGLTYGASEGGAVQHFRTALKLIPRSAIARIEYADALLSLSGKAGLAEAKRLYTEAAQCDALDAMERLDVQRARDELAA